MLCSYVRHQRIRFLSPFCRKLGLAFDVMVSNEFNVFRRNFRNAPHARNRKNFSLELMGLNDFSIWSV